MTNKNEMRGFFDYALRASLRMTALLIDDGLVGS